jgi:hypothetical protein
MAPQFRTLSSRWARSYFSFVERARKEIGLTKKFSTQPPAAKRSFSLMRWLAYTSGKLSMASKKCFAVVF